MAKFDLGKLATGVAAGAEIWDYMKTQDTAREGAEEAKKAAQESIATTREYLDPYAKAGAEATGGYLELLRDPSAIRRDPGYAFQQREQQRAIERSAAAGGGLMSGRTLATLQERGGELAATSYDQALKRRLDVMNIGLPAAQTASQEIGQAQRDIGQAAIDRETLQMINRGQTISGLIGLMEAMKQPSVGPGGGAASGGGAGGDGGGIPIIGDWSLGDIPDAIQAGAHEVGDFYNWLQDPDNSIFDPSTWDLPSFEGIADYTVNDFFGDLGFL